MAKAFRRSAAGWPQATLACLIGLALAALLTLAATQDALSQAFESRAPQAYLFDVNSRTVLYARNANQTFDPASMAKTVTAALVFEDVAGGDVGLETLLSISEDAWRRGGGPSGRAAMFAELGSEVAVADLLRGLIVIGGNDAAIALAEGLDGNEDRFAERMTALAQRWGATDSTFTNATGEPQAGMRSTVRDLVVFATQLIERHPDLYAIYGEDAFTWNGINQTNRNPIFGAIEGADGLFAGFSEQAGYGVVGSVVRDGRRIVFALSGIDTAEGRVDEARRLVRYAFEDFQTVRIGEPGEPIAFARTYGGAAREVGMIAEGGAALDLLLPNEGVERVRARVIYDSPVATPIAAGQPLGRLLVERDGTIIQETPLVAASDVATGSTMQRARDGFLELVLGWLPPLSFAGSL